MNGFLKLVLQAQDMQMSSQALALYRLENTGSKWLNENYPHIMSQLNELTLDWTLMPKSVVLNPNTLVRQVEVYKSNLEIAIPPLPHEVTEQQYRELMNKLIAFLLEQVLPILEKMPLVKRPIAIEEVETLAATEESLKEVFKRPKKRVHIMGATAKS